MAARGNTDGTDERNFASQFNRLARKTAHGHPMANGTTQHANTSIETAIGKPPPMHQLGVDGHRSDSVNNSPVMTAPRSHSRDLSNTHYATASDAGYRNGPNTESGSRS